MASVIYRVGQVRYMIYKEGQVLLQSGTSLMHPL